MVTSEEAKHFARQKIAMINEFMANWKKGHGAEPTYQKLGIIEDGTGDTIWKTDNYREMPRCGCGREMIEGVIANSDPDKSSLSWWRWWCPNEECRKARMALVRDRVDEYRRTGGKSHMDKAYEAMNIPQSFRGTTLSGLDSKKAVSFARETIRSGDNLLITGGTGVGKTHLAVGLMIEYGRMKPNTFRFENVPSMIRNLNAAIKRDEDYTLIEETLERYNTLVLDDLGAEKTTDHVRAVLYRIINGRSLMARQTIVTTNLTHEQIKEKMDERLASRLSEYRTLVMKGADARRARKAG